MKLTREDKALQLFNQGAVSKINDDLYNVKSQANENSYEVVPSLNVCNCMDFELRGLPCKHVMSVIMYRTSQIAAVVTAARFNKIGVVA